MEADSLALSLRFRAQLMMVQATGFEGSCSRLDGAEVTRSSRDVVGAKSDSRCRLNDALVRSFGPGTFFHNVGSGSQYIFPIAWISLKSSQ